MPLAAAGPSGRRPRLKIFVSLARGPDIRTVGLRAGTLRAVAAGALLLTGWLVTSTAYLVFHDDLVSALIAREAATQYAYEDRIAALRGQVEHEASLKLVGETALEGKLKALGTRAAALEARASLLTEVGSRTGVGRRSGETIAGEAEAIDASPTGTVPHALPLAQRPGAAKPHLDSESSAADVLPGRDDGQPFSIRLAAIEERLEVIDATQYRSLAGIRGAVRSRAEALRTAIASAGLAADRFVPQGHPAEGGPFVPLDPAIAHSAFGQALDAMQSDVASADELTRALPHLPFATPLNGPLEVSSPYGARLDPFLGRPAMHTGVDLREGYGTEVHATAAGRVVSAGPAGGYGTMVEIDHGHGLSTRYAHLESVEVAVGQVVDKGALVGEVGSTGRATGPHLHYETRIDGEAVDPVRFLNAGLRLAANDITP